MSPLRILPLVVAVLSVGACKPRVASAPECDAVARHLAELQVKKEKRPPLGRLAIAPFNTKENEDSVFEEAQTNAKGRCLKGWKREIFDCMMNAKEIEEADKCRYL